MSRLLLISVVLFACSSPVQSGASCPTSGGPTYASFGAAFFAHYCTGCHSRSASARFGAPADVNFDTEDDIRASALAVDAEAAAGPDATNTDMPDMGGMVHVPPSLSERELLGQFLACERAR